MIADISADGGTRLAVEIERLGGTVLAVPCDVSNEAQVDKAVAATLDEFGGIGILVNNAGVNAAGDQAIASLPLEERGRVFNVNTKGEFLSCRAVVPSMNAIRQGSIVDISSNGADYGSDGGHAYRTSKAALFSLTRALAIELASEGIGVTCLAPRAMDSPMRQLAAKTGPCVSPATVPLGRSADPPEIASFVMFLSSAEVSCVTGTTFVAEGEGRLFGPIAKNRSLRTESAV